MRPVQRSLVPPAVSRLLFHPHEPEVGSESEIKDSSVYLDTSSIPKQSQMRNRCQCSQGRAGCLGVPLSCSSLGNPFMILHHRYGQHQLRATACWVPNTKQLVSPSSPVRQVPPCFNFSNEEIEVEWLSDLPNIWGPETNSGQLLKSLSSAFVAVESPESSSASARGWERGRSVSHSSLQDQQ